VIAKKGAAEPGLVGDGLLRRLDELEQRVAGLERSLAAAGEASPGVSLPTATDDSSTDDSSGADFSGAESNGADSDGADSGRVSYGGDVRLNGEVSWNIGVTAAAVLELPGASGSAVLAGLGHPTRGALVRRLLTGPATTTQLQQVVANSSTGQLYHHLRTLTNCGLVEPDGRGRYRIPPTAVVPALVLLLASADVAGDLR